MQKKPNTNEWQKAIYKQGFEKDEIHVTCSAIILSMLFRNNN